MGCGSGAAGAVVPGRAAFRGAAGSGATRDRAVQGSRLVAAWKKPQAGTGRAGATRPIARRDSRGVTRKESVVLVAVAEILLGVVVVITARQVHVALFPWKSCPRCNSRKRNYSGNAHRDCARCGATGRVRRLGARKEE